MRPGILLTALLLTACQKPEWKGWVYPNRSDLADDIPLGAFETLEQCRASALAVLERTQERRDENGDEIVGDYECGFQCKPDGGLGGLNVCKKTER